VKLNPPPVNVIPPLNVTDIYYSFYYCIPEVAARNQATTLRGPRTLAVAVSVAYVIRCVVDSGPEPPPYHPAVGVEGGGAALKLTPPPVIVIPPVVIDIL
jgi:hypothetical protein